MNLKEAAYAPITLDNAHQIVDVENSYIVRQKGHHVAFLRQNTFPHPNTPYEVQIRTDEGKYRYYFPSNIQEAVAYLNNLTRAWK